jgi:hypothetical protein
MSTPNASNQPISPAFWFHAIPTAELDAVRSGGVDARGVPVERVGAEGGDPLRCCLRGAESGQSLILFGYEPPLPATPYREIGAVLAHAEPCGGPASTTSYPSDWLARPQVFRAYDHRGWIHDATRLYDGQDAERVLAEMFADPEVERVHSRNIAWGCYMFTITRAA